jgi:hypothetical protein
MIGKLKLGSRYYFKDSLYKQVIDKIKLNEYIIVGSHRPSGTPLGTSVLRNHV